MRAMFTSMAAALLCAGLASCNESHPVNTVTAAPTRIAVAPPAPPPAAAPAAAVAHHPRHRHAWHAQESHSDESYSQSGESESSSQGEDETAASSAPPPASGPEPAVWVDGYGRSHYVAAGPEDANPAALTREDLHKRMAPWRAYDSKCAERD
jgi:hypothetical protein